MHTLLFTSNVLEVCYLYCGGGDACWQVHRENCNDASELQRIQLLRSHPWLALSDRTTRLSERSTRLLERTTRVLDRTTRLLDRTTRLLGRTTRLFRTTTTLYRPGFDQYLIRIWSGFDQNLIGIPYGFDQKLIRDPLIAHVNNVNWSVNSVTCIR